MCVCTLHTQGHDCPVRSMTWGHDGLWMVTTDDRGFVKYWQANLNNVHTFQAHTDPVRCSRWDRVAYNKLGSCKSVSVRCNYIDDNDIMFLVWFGAISLICIFELVMVIQLLNPRFIENYT